MTRSRRGLVVSALVMLGLFATACEENPVGRTCIIDLTGVAEGQAVISSPALECPSRTCLHQPVQGSLPEGVPEAVDMCTASCDTADDCDQVPESKCSTGFTCAVPVVTGPFCCRKMCICKDYLIIPDGGIPAPAACDQGNSANTCCNLAGREC